MLMTSGLNFGLKRTLPHLVGVSLGFPFLVLCMGFGLGGIFKAFPIFYVVLKYAGAAYMLYLAWAIAVSNPHAENAKARKRPFKFIEAALFQWVNPKAWIMAVGAVSAYDAIAPYPFNALIIAGIFCVLGFSSSFTWACFGRGLQHLLKTPKLLRAFNILMALLLVASIYPVLKE
jgi:threonine/homoserine/homoserine lactone efflux protein